MTKKFSLNKKAFNKGADDVLTLSPLRKALKDTSKLVGDKMETMPTMHEMNINFIRKIRQLGRF